MAGSRSDLGWLIAVVFAGTTALFAWQYARARTETASLRNDYTALQERLTEQDERNRVLMNDLQGMQQQLDAAVSQIEAMQQRFESTLSTDATVEPEQ